MRARVSTRWSSLPATARSQFVITLLIAGLVYTFHYLVFCWPQPFFIEDSGISFAFARHLVDGEGLVAYPGGERVEGYSNALWTFLVAAAYALGATPWFSSKVFGYVFGVLALLYTWALTRRARPGSEDFFPILAPLLLAASPQFVLWNASGLENSLFCVLLAGGGWRLVKEIQDGEAMPWSALCFFGLTMTRPDGLAYAAVALFARVCGTIMRPRGGGRRQWLALGAWILALATPYALYNAWRYDYFAWPWPNTYYAKEKGVTLFRWGGGGWNYVKNYMTNYGIVFAAPLFVVALTGARGWRKWIGVVLLVFLAVFLLWDGRRGIPITWINETTRIVTRNWNEARVWYITGAAVVLGFLNFGRPGWEARGLLWASFCAGVFFAVLSQGDWMSEWRWFSLTSVPVFSLLAIGIGELVPSLPFAGRRIRGRVPVAPILAVACFAGLIVPDVRHTYDYVYDAETQVRDVRKRVNYMAWVQRRLGIEHVTLLDVDMGAHLWYSGWDIADMAGLVDVVTAHHMAWPRSFATDYIFDERKPDFAHVHGHWANRTKINKNERWTEDYVEIPGYPSGKRSLHVGNHVRKEHFFGKRYVGPEDRAVAFEGAITLEGWELPAPAVAAGGKLYVSTTWRATREEGFRVVAFLVNDEGKTFSAEVAPGYDWYRPERWKAQEFVYGRWNVSIPGSLPLGTYDFGFVLLDEKTGAVLAEAPAGDGEAVPGEEIAVPAASPRFMAGEWRVPDAVRIVSGSEATQLAEDRLADALEKASAGDCEASQEAWRNARRHIARNNSWHLAHEDAATDAAVLCLVTRARAEETDEAKVALLVEAHALDHRNPAYLDLAVPLAQKLEDRGDTLREASDWEGAFRAYRDALRIDPSRSWARRHAEEMRDKRLGLVDGAEPPKVVPPKAAREKPAGRVTGKGKARPVEARMPDEADGTDVSAETEAEEGEPVGEDAPAGDGD